MSDDEMLDASEGSIGQSASTAELERVIRNGITMEEHLLYLASAESHWRLRNVGLPLGVCMLDIESLKRMDYLETHPILPDALGAICEYKLAPEGNKRLRTLRAARSNAEGKPTPD